MPRSISPEYKSSCCKLASVQGWFILFRTHEFTWICYERGLLENVCLSAYSAVIESKHRLRNWELSTFHRFFLLLLLDQLCRTERQVRLLFFAWLLLSEWNQHWKFPPLIITATKSLPLSPAHMSHTTHTYTHSKKGTTMVPGNNMRALRQAQRQINTHLHKLPTVPLNSHPDLGGVSLVEKLIQRCVGGAGEREARGWHTEIQKQSGVICWRCEVVQVTDAVN